MSEAAAAEPTMEEILASIRRIISEDETPVADAAPEAHEDEEAPEAAPVAAAPAPAIAEPAPPPPPPPKEEVLELTQRVEPPAPAPVVEPPPASSSMGDLDFSDADVAPAAPPPAPPPKVESLVSDHAASAAAGHFGALGAALLMPAAGRTLEDVVKELMKPMLKAWLDENLPSITEAAVRSEVERISRRGH